MADIERNSNKEGNNGSKKYDPLLELTRLFSGESAEQEMYQSGEYPVLEDSLSAYPSLPEEKSAGYGQAFRPEDTANPYDADAPFAGLESASENKVDENMPAPDTADITGDILAQAFPAAGAAPKVQADDSAAFWLQDVHQAFEAEILPEPAVQASETQPVQPEPYPYEALDDVPAPLPDSEPSLMVQEWPQFEEQNKADMRLAEADSYFAGILPEDTIFPAEKQHKDAEEPPFFAAYEIEESEVKKTAMDGEKTLDVSVIQPVSFESLQEEVFPEQPAATETAPVVVRDYEEKADYGMEAAYAPDEPASVTETELSEAEQEFVDVLNTLDMRISAEDGENPVTVEEMLHEPEVNTIGIESDSVADIDNFDLPVPVYNDDEAKAHEHAALEQEFADIFDQRFQQTAEQAAGTEQPLQDETELFAAQMPWDEPETEPVREEENIDKNSAAYDWLTVPAVADNHMQTHDRKYSGGKRRFSYGLGALLVLAGAGAGAYFYAPALFGGDTVPVIIQADEGDVRVLPDHDSHANTATSAVYDSGGNTQNSPQQEHLINNTENPMDVPAGDEAGGTETTDEGGNVDTPVEESSAVTPPVRQQAAETAYGDQPPQSTETGLDGLSIESLVNEAAAKSLPVYVVPTVSVQPGQEKMPGVPAGEKAEVRIAGQIQDDGAETGKTAVAETQTDVSAGQSDKIAVTAVKPADAQTVTSGIQNTGQTAGHTAATGSQIATGPRIIIPPVPDVRPKTPPAPVQDIAPRAVQMKHTANTMTHTSGVYVQIASQPSHAAAQQSAATAKRHFASVLGNSDLIIVDADIPGKGTYYRVRIPVSDRAAASELCGRYQAAGGSCFVVKE